MIYLLSLHSTVIFLLQELYIANYGILSLDRLLFDKHIFIHKD